MNKVGNKPRTNGDDRSRMGVREGSQKERKRTTPKGPISPTQRHGRLMEHQPGGGRAAGVAAVSNWNKARDLIVSRPSKLVDDLIEWRNVVIARSGSPVAASELSVW